MWPSLGNEVHWETQKDADTPDVSSLFPLTGDIGFIPKANAQV